MGSKRLAGMEVPIAGSDSVKWFEVTVPSASPSHSSLAAPNAIPAPPPPPCAPPTEDAASCSIIGNPPTYLIWRILKGQPHALEVLELCGHKEFPRIGLQIRFPDALSPFALICKDETKHASGNPYMLYTLTVSGVAYLLKLKNVDNYASCSIFPPNEIIKFNIQTYPHHGEVTTVAATAGRLVIGRNDGSIGCFLLGIREPSSRAFAHELRDETGFSPLWSTVHRGRTVAAVQDMVISEVLGKKLLFVLHSDWILRVWDLFGRIGIFICNISDPTLTEVATVRLWVGEANNDTSLIPLAIQYNTLRRGREKNPKK